MRAYSACLPAIFTLFLFLTFGLIPASGQTLAITTGPDLGTFPVGVVEIPLEATGGSGSYVWTYVSGPLPTGLAIRSDPPFPGWFPPGTTAELGGLATAPDLYNFRLRVSDGSTTAERDFTLRVAGFKITDQYSITEGHVNIPYTHTMSATGAGTTWTATSPMPPGLSLNSSGVISGTPSASGEYWFNVQATQGGVTVAGGYNISIRPFRITSALLPNATAGVAYSTTLTTDGGAGGTYTWSAGWVPPGLTLAANGTLSGTPSSDAGNYRFWVTATETSTGQSFNRQVSLCYLGSPAILPEIGQWPAQGNRLDDAEVGNPYLKTLWVNFGKGPYTWSAIGLPSWLTARSAVYSWNAPSDAELLGTPTAAGDHTFTLRVTDSSVPPVTVERQFTLRVSVLSITSPPGGGVLDAPYSSTLRILGGSGIGYTWSGTDLPSGLSLNASTGLLSGTPVENGPFNLHLNVGDSASNLLERYWWMHIANGSSPDLFIHYGNIPPVGSAGNGYWWQPGTNMPADQWTIESGTLPAGLLLNGATGVFSGTPTAAGTQTILVRFWHSSNPANVGKRQLTFQISPVRVTSNYNLPWGNASASYSGSFTAAGGTGNYTWSLLPDGVFPPGLTLDPVTGGVTGTPSATAAGRYGYHISVSDGSGSPAFTFWGWVSIYPPGAYPPVAITVNPNLGVWSIGSMDYYLWHDGGNGASYTWEHIGGTLPPGIALRTDALSDPPPPNAKASLLGVATQTGDYSFTLRLTSGTSSDTKTFTVRVTSLVNKDPVLTDAYVGVPYSFQLTAAGNTGGVTFALQPDGQNPVGLTVAPDGTVSGTPTSANNNARLHFTIADSTGTVYRSVQIRVSAIRVTTGPVLPNATQGAAYGPVTLAASGGTPPYNWSAQGGLPNGLTLSPEGVISGTVNSGPGNYFFQITVNDGATNSYTRQYSICVVRVPVTLPQLTTGDNFDDWPVGEARWFQISAAGGTGPYTFSATGLPPGVSIRTTTVSDWNRMPGVGELWGAPTAVGTYTVVVSATDSSSPPVTVSRPYTIRVSRLSFRASWPPPTRDSAFSGKIRVIGGTPPYGPVTLFDGKLPAGLSLSPAGDLSGTPLENAYVHAWYTGNDSALPAANTVRFQNGMYVNNPTGTAEVTTHYNLGDVTVNGSYSRQLSAWGAPAFVWSVNAGPALPPGLSLSATGVLSGTPTAIGTYLFLIRAADSANPSGNYGIREFRMNVTPLSLTSDTNLQWTNVGSSVNFPLTVAGATGAVTWVPAFGSTLPPGVTISGGSLIGSPTSAGSYSFELVATDTATGATLRRNFSISIYPLGVVPPVAISMNTNLGMWSIGGVDTYLNHEGGNGISYTWEHVGGTLPAGVAIRTDLMPNQAPTNAKATLLGVATLPYGFNFQDYSFTLRVTSGGSSDTKTFTVRVTRLVNRDPVLPDGYVGIPYNFQLTAAGNTGPVTFALQPHSQNPPGLTVAPDGTVSGIPTTAVNNTQLHFSMTDSTGTVGRSVSIRVSAIQVTTAPVLPNATQGAAYGPVTLVAGGGTPPYNWSTPGSLPNGLSISSAGVISGTVNTGPGDYSFQLTVGDSDGNLYTRQYSICVVGVPLTLPQLTTPDNFEDWMLGGARWFQVFAGGGTGPYSFSATGLPPGVSIRTTSDSDWNRVPGVGELWGAPTEVGTYTVVVSATDSSSPPVTVSRPYTVRVSRLGRDWYLPWGTRDSAYSGKFRIRGGTAPYGPIQLFDGKIHAGLTLNGATGDLTGTPLENGSLSSGQWYTVSDSAPTPNTLRFFQCCDNLYMGNPTGTVYINRNWNLGDVTVNTSYSRQLNASGAPSFAWSHNPGSPPLPPGLTLSSTGQLSGTPTAVGTYFFLIRAAEDGNQAGNYGIREFRLIVTPLSLTSNTNLQWTNVGTGVNFPLTVSGATGTVTWALALGSTLPPGVTIGGGALAGSPTSAGSYSFELIATDSGTGGTIRRTFNIAIYPSGARPPLFLGLNDQNVSVGPLTVTLNASGGVPPYTYSWAGATIPGVRVQSGPPLPSGWTATGGLLGVLTAPGVHNTIIRVTDSDSPAKTFDRPFKLTVSPVVVTNAGNLPSAVINSPYTPFTFTATGGTPPYLWTWNGPPPSEFNLSTGGVLSGTRTQPGFPNIDVTVTDAAGNTAFYGTRVEVASLQITTPGLLPVGTVNSPYSFTLTASGATGPVSWTRTGGGLPGGLSLDSATGVISGTPTGTARNSFTIRATDSTLKTAFRVFTLQVLNSGAQPALSISTGAGLPDTTVGNGYSQHLNTSGGTPPYVWELEPGSTLPAGLILVSSADSYWSDGAPAFAALYGRPYQADNYSFTLRVTDGASNTVTRTFTLRVSPVQINYTNLPISGTTLVYNVPYSQAMLAIGGSATTSAGYTWSAPVSGMPANLALSSGGLLNGTPVTTGYTGVPVTIDDGSGGLITQTVSFTIASGTTATLSFSPNQDLGSYVNGGFINVGLGVQGSPLPVPAYVVTVDSGPLPPGLVLVQGAAAGGSVAALIGSPSAPGVYSFTLKVTDAALNVGYKKFTMSISANMFFTGGGLPDAAAAQSYSQTLLAWGASQTWSLAAGSSLPAGLVLSSSGVLSGTLTAPAGNYSFTVNLTDGAGVTITRTFNLRVSPLNITNPGFIEVQATRWTPFTYTFNGTGGSSLTFGFAGGGPPSGLSLSPAGVLSGTPQYSGNYTFMIEVKDSNPATLPFIKRFMLVVKEPNPAVLSVALSATGLPNTTLGQSFNMAITPSGGVPPYNVGLDVGSTLPAGVQIVGGVNPPPGQYPGVLRLAGIPTTAGSPSFTLVFSDTAGNQTKRTFNLKVAPLGFAGGLPNGKFNVPYTYQLTAIGGTSPYEFSIVSGLLPAGLTMNSSGLVSGTPVNAGFFGNILIEVKDALNQRMRRSVGIQVNTAQPVTLDLATSTSVADGSVGVNRRIYMFPNGATGPVTWSVESGSTLPPGMALLDAATIPDWQGYIPNEAAVQGAPSAPGVYSFAIRATEVATGNFGVKTYTWRVTPINFVEPEPLPDGRAGTPYGPRQLVVAGGAGSYTFSAAPNSMMVPGLTVSSSGLLSGTPQVSGRFGIPLLITDSAGNSLTYSPAITILQAGQNSPLIVNPPTAGFEVEPATGQPFWYRLNKLIRGGTPPFTWSLGSSSLPAGLQLVSAPHPAGYHIVGSAVAAGEFEFTLSVTDSAGQAVSLPDAELLVSPVRVSPDVLPVATAGAPYAVAITAAGGVSPVTVQVSPWSYMPGGLNFAGGILSGTPTSPGVFRLILEVRDGATPATHPYYRFYQLVVDSPTTPVPAPSVDPGVVRITYEKGPPPPVTPLNITSAGGPMAFSASVNGIALASLSVTGGTTPRVSNLALDPAIADGDYVGLVAVNPPSSSVASPAVAPVFLKVLPLAPCTYAVSPSSATILAAGGSGTLTITTDTWCAWTATTSETWIAFSSPTSGSGSGTVSYNVGANPSPNPRNATVTVQGQTQAVSQFGAACSFSIDPAVVAAGPGGAAGVVTITASAPLCLWSAGSPSADLTFSGPTSGTGSGSIAFNITANTLGGGRSLNATIAGQPFRVDQAGVGCTVGLSSSSATATAAGGPITVGVTLPVGCSYATVPGPSWITVASGGTGSGPGGTVELSVAANSTTTARYGTVQVGGQPFEVSQQGVACSISVSGSNPILPVGGGGGSFTVSTNGPNCDWNSTASAQWLQITSGATGVGNGTVNYQALSNASSTSPRNATLTIAGQALTINQAGTVCTFELRSSSGNVAFGGGSGSVGLITAPVCPWSAVSSDPSWLTVGTVSGSGGEDIAFSALPNPSANPRSATISVGGLTYTVSQPGAPCSVTLSATSTSAPASGASGSFTFSTSVESCPDPVVQSFAGWITATSTFAGTSGTVNFTVYGNPAGLTRTGVIQVNDRTYSIQQTAATCSYTLSTIGAAFSYTGGPGSFLASQNLIGCTNPAVVANPEITLAPYTTSGNQFTQPYTVAPYSSLTPWVRLLYIDFGGQIFTVKQTSW